MYVTNHNISNFNHAKIFVVGEPTATVCMLKGFNATNNVMQSDGNSFCGDVVLDIVTMAFGDKDRLKGYKSNMFKLFFDVFNFCITL